MSSSNCCFLTCILRNLYASQEAAVRSGHGITGWFQIRKGVHQCFIFSPCLFNLHAEYIIQNAELDETQAGIKIARKDINNLRYTDDTTLTAESKEELKSLLMKVKEDSEKVGFKLNTRILISFLISSVICWLFSSVFFSLHMLEFLIVYCIVVRKDAWNDFNFFEFTKASFMAQDVIYPGEGSMCA